MNELFDYSQEGWYMTDKKRNGVNVYGPRFKEGSNYFEYEEAFFRNPLSIIVAEYEKGFFKPKFTGLFYHVFIDDIIYRSDGRQKTLVNKDFANNTNFVSDLLSFVQTVFHNNGMQNYMVLLWDEESKEVFYPQNMKYAFSLARNR